MKGEMDEHREKKGGTENRMKGEQKARETVGKAFIRRGLMGKTHKRKLK